MSRNLRTPHPYDDGIIDDRNLRPLAIAFVTILIGWMVAFGLFFVSTQTGGQSQHVADGSAPGISTTIR
jgi:hypothetical protein